MKRHRSQRSRTRYASGKRAKAQCPICGLTCAYAEMTLDWRGVRVCPDCLDPKHPQETPVITADAVALRRPAPLLDTGTTEAVDQLTDEDGFETTFGS